MNKIYFIVVTIVIGIISFFLYNKLAFLNLVVKFDDLEPFEKQMDVYYKGFKIGKTTKIYPDEDYQNTYLKLKIHPHNIKLPNNITAKIKKSTLNNYISIEYPDSPSLTRIKNYDEIKGKSSKDITSALNENVEAIVDNTTTLIESANVTVQNLGEVFSQINEILKDIKGDIKLSTKNLANATANLESTTEKLNNSLGEKEMTNSVKNIEETTKNIQEITKQIDKTTMPIINSALCETNAAMKNVKEITGGIKNTLKKNMGFGRVLFGKPINEKCD